MATAGRENFNPAYKAFRKHSADLLTVIQDPEVLAWELFSESVVSLTVVEFANNVTHERGTRNSNLLMAVGSQIEVDPGVFHVFLSVLAKRPSMSDFCGRIKDTYSKSPGTAYTNRGSADICRLQYVLLSVGLPPSYLHTRYANMKEEGLEDFVTHHVQ